MSAPASVPLIWPARITTPLGPMPGTATPALSPMVHGPIGGGSSTADFNSGGVIQKGYVMNPFAGKFQDSIIKEGHAVFVYRGDPMPQAPGAKGSADAAAYTLVSLAMMNMILHDSYTEAMSTLSEYADRNRGLPGNGLLKFLERDEAGWGELYAKNGKQIRADHVFKTFYYLTREGILNRWNFLGFSILASAPDAQTRGEFAYLPLNVAVKGVRKYIANVWGENAGQASNLFLVLKRRQNPATGEWGAFAFHPYASNYPQVPLHVRQYQGLNGATEYGTVLALGRVQDTRKMTLPPEKLLYVQGLHPECSPTKEREIAKQIPILEVAIHQNLCKVLVCC